MRFRVLNRGMSRRRIFEKEADYAFFEAIVEVTFEKCPMRICGDCLMPTRY